MKWSANLAYAAGLIATDGCLSSDGRHIDLTSKNLEQIKTFADILNLNNKIGTKKSGFAPLKQYYRIQFGRVKLYRFLQRAGLTPNKSKSMGKLKIPDKYFIDFLRGHLDGDGHTYSYWDNRWKSSFMLYTGFTSASKQHLDWIRASIHRLYGLKGAIKPGKSVYQLMYAKKASVTLLTKIYYKEDLPCLLRKRSKIEASLGIIYKQAGVEKLVYSHR